MLLPPWMGEEPWLHGSSTGPSRSCSSGRSSRRRGPPRRGKPGHRSDVWLSGGLGGGFDEEIEWGPSGYFRLGGTLSCSVLLGGELVTFEVDQGDLDVTRTNLTASLLAYPSADGPLFLEAGLGLGVHEVSAEVQGVTVSASDEVLAVDFGLGYDLHLGSGNLYLTPNVDALLQIDDGDVGDTDASFLFSTGIGFR